MDIAKYAGYFHDGYVNDVSHIGKNISFSLESSVVENLDEIEDKNLLSDSNSLKGTLIVHNIKTSNWGIRNIQVFFKWSMMMEIFLI